MVYFINCLQVQNGGTTTRRQEVSSSGDDNNKQTVARYYINNVPNIKYPDWVYLNTPT